MNEDIRKDGRLKLGRVSDTLLNSSTSLPGEPRAAPEGAARPSVATLSGVETVVRLLMLRHLLDARGGLNTATMVSGYPGSPLGGLDLTIEAQADVLGQHRVRHQPGLNEELALATVWGSQMGRAVEYAGVDGVAGVWYGKTPGLDRCGDVLRHANAMGAGPNGGVVMFCGDDPTAKSSTLAYESQYAFQDACVPLLFPGNQQEVIDLGVHAFWLSRFAGPIVGMKIMTAVADGTGTVDFGEARIAPPIFPEVEIGGRRWIHQPLATIGPHKVPDQELLVTHSRLAAAKAYVRANALDRIVGAGPGARLGILCAGKTFHDLVQAFSDLGLGIEDLEAQGVRVLKLAMTYPIVEQTLIEFARSVDLLLVIEEKRPFVEDQARAILHEAGVATPLLGKRDGDRLPLVSAVGELSSADIVEILARVLPELAERRRADPLEALLPALQIPPRPPSYCSGCPHNRSTVVPEGELAGGGVGCHGILYFEARQLGVQKMPPPPMGAEGVPWIGLAPFVDTPHLLQNLGDGTFSHSGILAIRASVAAGVNTTFKILYNSTVAMTGGQDVTGLLDVPALTRALEAESVRRIVVCSDDPGRYGDSARWAPGVQVRDREDLPEVQEELRHVSGVTVIIYDQRCATEARRLRKRGLLETPAARVVINDSVCENCGDCVVKSNCVSVQPRVTEFGPKKRIDQLTCNRDYTCVEGDCPSFVTITPRESGKPAKPGLSRSKVRPVLPGGDLPEAAAAPVSGQFGIYFTGIGGTGVVTANRTLAAAAEAAGLLVIGLDQTGLAQKGGAVVSHLRLARTQDALGSATIGSGGADLYLSGDLLQAAGPLHLDRIKPGRSIAVIESDLTPTAAMIQTGGAAPDVSALRKQVTNRVAGGRAAFVETKRIADLVFSDAVLANMVLLGAAYQLGGLPFTLADMLSAFERQGRTGAKSRAAFEWGRWAVHDPEAVAAALAAAETKGRTVPASPFEPSPGALEAAATIVGARRLPESLTALLVRRTAQVIEYQGKGLTRRFLDLVEHAAARDSGADDWALTRAVAEGWFKLLTYKDEYEVARLHSATSYDDIARDMGIEGGFDVRYHLHPTFLRRLGLRHKLVMGKPLELTFAVLKHLKPLRGTPFDVFGWDPERRLERAVAAEYEATMREALDALPYDVALELASSPAQVRGYGPVKERNIAAWRQRVAELRKGGDLKGGPAALSAEKPARSEAAAPSQ